MTIFGYLYHAFTSLVEVGEHTILVVAKDGHSFIQMACDQMISL